MKKFISLFLIFTLVLSSVGVSSAGNYSDPPISTDVDDGSVPWYQIPFVESDYDNNKTIPSWAMDSIKYFHKLDKLHNKILKLMPDNYSSKITRREYVALVMNAVYTIGQNSDYRRTGSMAYPPTAYSYKRMGSGNGFKTFVDLTEGFEPSTFEFNDTYANDSWADHNNTVADAHYLNIIGGKYETSKGSYFRPKDYLTREEAAVILVKAFLVTMSYHDYNTKDMLVFRHTKSSYNDFDTISDWAKPYVDIATQLGMFSGDDKGNFNPKDHITFAQAHVIVKPFIAEELIFTDVIKPGIDMSDAESEFQYYLENYKFYSH